jgi:hypothetical protein
LESCNLSNFDQATEKGDQSLCRERDERGRLDLDCGSAVTRSTAGRNVGLILFVEIAQVDATPLAHRGSSFINSLKLSNCDQTAADLLAILAREEDYG